MVIGTPNYSISRAVKLVLKAQATRNGVSIPLHRVIGNPSLQEIDPFLLLDAPGHLRHEHSRRDRSGEP